jgi:hypothetical protein
MSTFGARALWAVKSGPGPKGSRSVTSKRARNRKKNQTALLSAPMHRLT